MRKRARPLHEHILENESLPRGEVALRGRYIVRLERRFASFSLSFQSSTQAEATRLAVSQRAETVARKRHELPRTQRGGGSKS